MSERGSGKRGIAAVLSGVGALMPVSMAICSSKKAKEFCLSYTGYDQGSCAVLVRITGPGHDARLNLMMCQIAATPSRQPIFLPSA